jgi:predicted nucleic acid-binding protein
MTFVPRPLRERRTFVDSSGYLALLDLDDDHHDEAVAIVDRLANERYRQYTTNAVMIKAHALIFSALGIGPATRFLQRLEAGSTVIVGVRAADEQRTKQLIYRNSDRSFSFTDAISFVVMERLRIDLAFAFDRHFVQYGFTLCTAG